jgi:hypothetical protein
MITKKRRAARGAFRAETLHSARAGGLSGASAHATIIGMEKPILIQIGNRILNIHAIRYLEIDGPQAVYVHVYEEALPLQFIEGEAEALLAALDSGYVCKVDPAMSHQRFEELIRGIEKEPNR